MRLSVFLLMSVGLFSSCSPNPKAEFKPNTLTTFVPDLEFRACGSSGSCLYESRLKANIIYNNFLKYDDDFSMIKIDGEKVVTDDYGNGLIVGENSSSFYLTESALEDGDHTGKFWESANDIKQRAEKRQVDIKRSPADIAKYLGVRNNYNCNEDHNTCVTITLKSPSIVAEELSKRISMDIVFDRKGEDYEVSDGSLRITMSSDTDGWKVLIEDTDRLSTGQW